MNFGPVISIVNAVRRFRPAYGLFISWDSREVGGAIARGSTVNVSDPVLRCYDHQDKVAIPIDFQGNEPAVEAFFILFEELSPQNQAQIRQLFPENRLVNHVH